MIIAREIADVRARVAEARAAGKRIGFVPTMGFLHEGHLSLIGLAREHGASFIVVSIFVNPLQFGPAEDFERYPRDEARDRRLLEERGVDLLFMPSVETMYPAGAVTRVIVGGVAEPLEGERRPGHFDGVATVVTKLFNVVRPDLAAFGQKDAQQCQVIRQFVRDLDVPVEIVVGPTEREADGLALSSRNAYLSRDERALAPRLHEALLAGRAALEGGATDAPTVEAAMARVLRAEARIEIDYLRVVDPTTFEAPVDLHRDLLAVGAIRLGRTRLIDNLPLPFAPSPAASGTPAALPEHERTR
ncbi:MAG TPA: pantoate--beta-alanine ligase [Thermoanaerobaculia bacterium]